MAILTISPDSHAAGLTGEPVDALRYDWHNDHPMEVAGMLRSMMPSGVRVLDVGCGTGSLTKIANRGRGNEVVGIEPDADRAAAARARGLDIRVGQLDADLQAELGLFDVVLASDVLEHIAGSEEFLATLARSLKPEGILLLSVPTSPIGAFVKCSFEVASIMLNSGSWMRPTSVGSRNARCRIC